MKKIICLIALSASCYTALAQYVEPEKAEKDEIKRKASEVITYPSIKFDSLQTKNALIEGKGKITGVAFTRPRSTYGANNPPRKILATKVKIRLYPVTPYFEEYYKLWKDKSKNNPKKNKYVLMADKALRLRLEAITNSSGEFTFPNMKPGKYYLCTNVEYSLDYSVKEYAGSGYGTYGTIDYYKSENYGKGYNDFLEGFVEVNADGQTAMINLKN
ncbi:carboxypeptidase-like regulatory domain-containing protein [Pedobacter mendelii]|uniref:Carboxypeptidase regulatory-like domain-containing protein n=1 Tax=Pedobacter mendelii TaxID=1908240 RepID=A0ABQ2BNF3_9SPHI|nr:carboxypeptidase-like regulatory domain-containing protein [Pedobacter mendelii]GGI28815.1 hypothetical protein GCM10008119_34530 [Pedobacter mendelii]